MVRFITIILMITQMLLAEESIHSKGITLYSDPNDYAAMPVIVRTEDGTLFVPFTIAKIQALQVDGRHPHYGLEQASSVFVCSTDDGKTWSEPKPWQGPLPINSPIVDIARGSGSASTAVALNDGRVMQVRKFVKLDDCISGFETRIDKNYDRNAEAPIRPIKGKYLHEQAYTWMMRQAPNGDVILGAYYLEHTPRLDPKIGTAHFFRTTPDANSWEYLAAVENPGKFHISESDFYFSQDGKWSAILRTDWGLWSDDEKPADADGYGFVRGGYGYYLYQTDSLDAGQKWSKPRRLPIWGHPPFLLPLKSGKLLMVYGVRREPWVVNAVLSQDGGLTWDVDKTCTLYYSKAVGIDFGNPVVTQLKNGEILCVTYGYASGDSRKFSAREIYAIKFNESLFDKSVENFGVKMK